MNRLKWFLLALTFVITYRVALHFFWLSDRRQYLSSAAYGDGVLDARAVIASTGPAVITLLCVFLLRAPRAIQVILLGLLAALSGFALQIACGDKILSTFGYRAAVHFPLTLTTILAVTAFTVFSWKRKRRRTAAV